MIKNKYCTLILLLLFSFLITNAYGLTLEILVTDPNSEGVSGVTVKVTPVGQSQIKPELKTKENGLAVYRDLSSGYYRIISRKTGYVEDERQINLVGDLPILVVLRRESKLSVVVVDSKGSPIDVLASVTIFLDDEESGRTTYTDSFGVASFDRVPEGTYVVVIRTGKKGSIQSDPFYVSAEGVNTEEIIFNPRSEIPGYSSISIMLGLLLGYAHLIRVRRV